jgi:hypothetical protein
VARYKVIQDIEAEDHILGPLSLRQFIYALITVFCLYIAFICVAKHIAFLAVLFLPPAFFFGFLAFPFKGDQPTEVWALAKLRFLVKPHRRVWSQSGVKEMVSITVPKRIELVLTDGLDQSEVKSRLRALADTIDTRGWAVKNSNVNTYGQVPQMQAATSDRLIDMSTLPQQVPDDDIRASDDILDEYSNAAAQQMDQMITASTNAHRQQIINTMNDTPFPGAPAAPTIPQTVTPVTPASDAWFTRPSSVAPPQYLPTDGTAPNQSGSTYQLSDAALPGSTAIATAEEEALLEHGRSQSDAEQLSYANLRTLQPVSADDSPLSIDDSAATPLNLTLPAPVTSMPDTAILSLANNNDLNVATLAREAHKAMNVGENPQDEVVVSLH